MAFPACWHCLNAAAAGGGRGRFELAEAVDIADVRHVWERELLYPIMQTYWTFIEAKRCGAYFAVH
jgi:hypothetical protein